jgi:hypothetical protein
MLSAPPVLVEPKNMIASNMSPAPQTNFDWVTQTPEPSPVCFSMVPPQQVADHFGVLQDACSPIWDQLLARVASHVDILEATNPLVRHQLIQTLCQPFFENIVEQLCREVSDESFSSKDAHQIQKAVLEQGKPRLSLGQRLGLWEEDSTDADNDSAFASLFSSDGEDCDVDCRQETEMESHASRFTARLTVCCEEDSESLQDVEKSQMVCRHWKSKGFCRYGSECKFLHPENKRGVTTEPATFSSLGGSRRGRGGKNKTSKVQVGTVDGFAVPLDLSAKWPSCEPCLPCMPFVRGGVWATELPSFK